MTTAFPEYIPSESVSEYHAVITVTYGELLAGKWIDWNDETWHWDAYNPEQYTRLCNKFNEHFYDREIGVLPPLSWKREFIRKMNEIMPKYKPFYKALENSNALLQVGDNYGKTRNVYSDFPATQIAPQSQDYASNATDNEYENINNGDIMERINNLKTYDDIDYAIIKEMDSMFSCFISVNIND